MTLLKTIADSFLTVKFDRRYTNFERVLPKVKKENQEKYHNKLISTNTKLFNTPAFYKILNSSNFAYMQHIGHTKTWLIDGLRLISSQDVENYIKRMRTLIDDHNQYVNDFINNWDLELALAQNQAGDVRDQIQWPSKEEFKAAFDISYYFVPIAQTFADTIVLPAEEFDALEKKIQQWTKNIYKHYLEEIIDELKVIRDKVSKQKHRATSLNQLEALLIVEAQEINPTTFNKDIQNLVHPIMDEYDSKMLKKYKNDVIRFTTLVDSVISQLETKKGDYQ